MIKTKSNVSFLWIGLIILSFIHLGSLKSQAYDIQDYFPLQVGDVRLYVVSETEDGQTRTFLEREPVSRIEPFREVQTFVLGELSMGCWDEEYDALAWDGEGLKMYREVECLDDSGQPEIIDFNPPSLMTPRYFDLGQTKNWTIREDGENISVEMTLEAIEDVTVYAGTFNNCLRMRWRIESGDGSENCQIWFAEGLGIVKEQCTETEDGQVTTEQKELAAAATDGTLYGSPLRTWQGEWFSFYLAHISTCGCNMVMNNVVIGLPGDIPGLWWIRFTLDITAVPLAWTITDFGQGAAPSLDPSSATACPSPISGLDFSQALHKINIDQSLFAPDPQLVMRFPFGGENYKIGFNFPPEKLSWDYYFLDVCQ
ncbi:MAG: hypothetical protein KAW01_02790 [Deltaproteobacteria bacterium]|nr:hypothetical protein [Deltaproteobacteria bacterium]